MGRVEGKVAIVTGAASGIGRATALLLAQQGAKVVCSDRSEDDLKETVALISPQKGEAIAVVCDVADEAAVQRLITACVSAYGRLDIMIANAGVVGDLSDFCSIPAPVLTTTFQINVFGVFYCIKHAVIQIKKQRSPGSIVLTSSVAGLRSGAGGVAYSASKAAVVSLAQTTSFQLAGTGIRVNAICPGLIETGMTQPIFDSAKKRSTEHKIGQLNNTRRAGRSIEVANLILFLASDEASYVNGQAIPVCGGLSSAHPNVISSAKL